MSYKFIDHTADIAFEANGKTLEELFESAALAVFDTMVDLNTVIGNEKKIIRLEAASIERLFLDFLEELIFLKDFKYMVFNKFEVKINNNRLDAVLHGDKINPSKHKLKVDVKAVTMHKFKLEKVKEGYKSFVILDI